MLEVKGIDTYYGNIQALRDVSLRVDDGEIVTLIGANGAGKSTTLMTICGINRPRKGEILWNGEPIHELPPHEIVRLGISQVPEGRLIFPDLSVRENLDLGAFLRNDVQGIKEDMDYVFDLFPILAQRRKQTGGTLSGGEQQMLAISRALMARPKLLLLDEPSLGLAPIIIQQIFQIIQRCLQIIYICNVIPPRLCDGERPYRHQRQRREPAQERGRAFRLSGHVKINGSQLPCRAVSLEGKEPPCAKAPPLF